MLGLRISVVVCMGVIACTKTEDRERPVADRSPYGELEIARAEVPTRVDTAPRAEPPRQPQTSQPSRATRPPAPRRAPPADPTESPDTTPTAGSPVPSDTSGYVPYPIEPAAETARNSSADSAGGIVNTAAVETAAADPAASRLPAPKSRPTPVGSAVAMVPAGTMIYVALQDSIHSRIDVSGKIVGAKVMENVAGPDGRTLIPAGTTVQLTVTQVKAGRGDGQGVLEIRPDSITLAGSARKLEATLQSVPYELRGRGVTGEEAAKVGVGAAGGAVVGRVLGGNTRGAVIGGVVGAAGGAVVASETAAKDVVVKARTPVALVLTAPIPIPR